MRTTETAIMIFIGRCYSNYWPANKLSVYCSQEMGATLSSRAEWTSARDKGGKLDFSKANEAVLLEILSYVEGLYKDHPREATVIFKRPFVWKSSLSLSKFENLRTVSNDEYVFRYIAMR